MNQPLIAIASHHLKLADRDLNRVARYTRLGMTAEVEAAGERARRNLGLAVRWQASHFEWSEPTAV